MTLSDFSRSLNMKSNRLSAVEFRIHYSLLAFNSNNMSISLPFYYRHMNVMKIPPISYPWAKISSLPQPHPPTHPSGRFYQNRITSSLRQRDSTIKKEVAWLLFEIFVKAHRHTHRSITRKGFHTFTVCTTSEIHLWAIFVYD